MLLQQRPLIRNVGGIGESLIDLEVIAPASQLEAIVAPALSEGGELGEGQIRELPCK